MKKMLIVYQLRAREFDNALLLKTIFENNGYIVSIKNDADTFCLFEKFDFIIWPCMYDNNQFDTLSYRFNSCGVPSISMRYEQIFTKHDEDTGVMAPKGKAQDIPTMNWGIADYNYCKMNGVPDKNLSVTGFITLDYLRPEFSGFWYNRDDIADRYNLSKDKKWLLFISSFALADNVEVAKTLYTYQEGEDAISISDLNTRSRKEILEWLENLILDDKSYNIIYRPHPAEKSDINLFSDLKKKYPNNFHVIPELNIKQWILTTDIITTWVSTSITECYVAKKHCLVLRPEPYPQKYDIVLYKDGKFITNYDEFKLEIENSSKQKDFKENFPISSDILNRYYDISDTPTYLRIVNEVEKHINDNPENEINRAQWLIKRWKYLIFKGYILKIYLKRIYQFTHKNFHFSIRDARLRKKYAIQTWEDEAVNKAFNKNDEENKLKKLKSMVNMYGNIK
ncbi:surface carbohydrate biosynthesis protein [Anoxynatronum buryatiense]|uniref:Surface carbohydrate biosynthesis protein n=1 Tax=Anoxynatronum buryatiense TaxID=489973 RepID=A0AA46AJ59_9CLOT|nr:surface carbohydrate biosynthesis protein [Anoxynatronum buryatiense]SMP56769.1 surface carbohydrate biosynthesis protein [Anoxynatronum buryatiense]